MITAVCIGVLIRVDMERSDKENTAKASESAVKKTRGGASYD